MIWTDTFTRLSSAAIEYFERLGFGTYDRFALDIDQWQRLMLKLSEFDPTSHYRTINRAEFTALWKAGQLVNKFASMCLIENGVAYGGKPDGTIDANPPYICPAEEMLTVREHK